MTYLLLEDGTRFDGDPAGAGAEITGEVVFNTGMSGYQESVTDPSYRGQIIVFTYPHIGNYGVSGDAMESDGIHARGVVMREGVDREDAPGAEAGWLTWLADCGVPGISGIDTRALVRHIRDKGSMRGGIFQDGTPESEARERVDAEPSMVGRDLACEVTPREPLILDPDNPGPAGGGDRHRHQGVDRAQPARARRAARAASVRVVLRRAPRARPRRGLPGQRPRRPRRHGLRRRRGARLRGQSPGVRHLHGPPAPVPGGRPRHLQAALRPPRRQPPVKDLATGQIDITSQNHGFAVQGPNGEGRMEGDEPVRWETDFGAAELRT